jgi:hypothetical protein
MDKIQQRITAASFGNFANTIQFRMIQPLNIRLFARKNKRFNN